MVSPAGLKKVRAPELRAYSKIHLLSTIIFYTLLTFVYKLLTIKIFLSALALSEAAFDYFSSSSLSLSRFRSRLSRGELKNI